MVLLEVFGTKHLTMIEYKKDLQPNCCCPQRSVRSFLDVHKYASAKYSSKDCLKKGTWLCIKNIYINLLETTSHHKILPISGSLKTEDT